jgi:predicted metalloprotease with PDZ domain
MLRVAANSRMTVLGDVRVRAWSAAALLALHCAAGWAAQDARYDVSLDFNTPLRAIVQATFLVPDGKLFMHEHAGGYEWSDYIRNLHAYKQDGGELPLQQAGRGKWTLSAPIDGPVRVNYEVDLTFTKQLREGTQRGGQFFGNSLYLVNRALFVTSNATGPILVKFIVPVNFQIATPWSPAGPAQFVVEDTSDLVDNTTILGDFPSFKIRQGDFYLTMALPGATSADKLLLQPVMQSALHEYIRIFPKTPEFHILLTYFRGVEINGEGYKDSATLTSADRIERSNRVMWANYLAHEFFHHWNAALIAGNDEGLNFGTTEWFAEGATEYIANRTLLRAGIIDTPTYLRMMETNIGMYEFWTWAAPFQGDSQSISLQEAASKTALPTPKGTVAKTYNRAAIYNGGWVATYCIDMLIQHRTSGKKGLDDLFRLLLQNYGLTKKRYTVADLAQNASEVAGVDLSEFFAKYVTAPNPLPVQECLKIGGFDAQILNYAGEAFITPSITATALEKTLRERLSK